jgi:hypothetical protein
MTRVHVTDRTAVRRFARHFLEMVVAMVVGMVLLGPVVSGLLWLVAGLRLSDHPVVAALVMATNMSIGMWVWMAYRRHDTVRILEMAAVMYASFVVLFFPYWAGTLSGRGLMMAGHLLMLPAMAGVMLLRREHYTLEQHTVTRKPGEPTAGPTTTDAP